MRVLIACEFSGIVRSAFSKMGWDAWSCDLLPTEIPGNHYQGDVLKILNAKPGWDLLIGHPPCQYLSYAGMGSWYDEGRAIKRIMAAEFFMKLWEAPVYRICLENPRGIMSKIFREPDQEVHPYFFGEPEMKRTGLWLKNLPKLEYQLEDDLFNKKTANEKPKPVFIDKGGKARYFIDSIRNKEQGKMRSKSFQSIGKAMAEQWTDAVTVCH